MTGSTIVGITVCMSLTVTLPSAADWKEQDHPSGDSKNDCWLSVNKSTWHKVWDEGGTNMQYTFDDEYHRGMVHELKQGENLVELACRVSGYAVDRIVAFANLSLPAEAWGDPQHKQNPPSSLTPDATIPPSVASLTASTVEATSVVLTWPADHAVAWWNGWSDTPSKPVHAVALGECKLTTTTTRVDHEYATAGGASRTTTGSCGKFDLRGRIVHNRNRAGTLVAARAQRRIEFLP